MPGFLINCSSTAYFTLPCSPKESYYCHLLQLVRLSYPHAALPSRLLRSTDGSREVYCTKHNQCSSTGTSNYLQRSGLDDTFCRRPLRLHMFCIVTAPVFRHQSRRTAFKVGVHNSDRGCGGIVQPLWLAATRAFHPAPPKRQERNRSAAVAIFVLVWVADLRGRLYAGASVFPVDGLAQDWLHDGEGDCKDALCRKKQKSQISTRSEKQEKTEFQLIAIGLTTADSAIDQSITSVDSQVSSMGFSLFTATTRRMEMTKMNEPREKTRVSCNFLRRFV